MIEQIPVHRDWYLPILAWIVPVIFTSYLSYALWSGKIHVSGRAYTRRDHNSTYWPGVVFLAVAALITGYWAWTDFVRVP